MSMASDAEPSSGASIQPMSCDATIPRRTPTNVSSAETRQQNFEQAVALSLHLWPALTVAVQNNWSDNDPDEVRDWFAGAVVDLFPTFPELDKFLATNGPNAKKPEYLEEPPTEDVESRLIQVMEDEYNVEVEDDSPFHTAEQIMRLRVACAKGQFTDVEALRERWLAGKGNKLVVEEAPTVDQDTEWEDDDDKDDDQDGPAAKDGAPPLAASPNDKAQPEVDEDGFTKVTRKR